MTKETEQLNNEIETIKRIVNGYLSQDPILEDFELHSLSIKRKRQLKETPELPVGEDLEVFIQLPENKQFAFVKCCTDSDGVQYPYYGPGPCPNGDQLC